MSEDEIRSDLSKATNLMQLIQAGNKLKKNGEDERVVNKILSEVRKGLVSRVAEIKKIPRKEFPQVPTEAISYIAFNVKDLSSPSVSMENGVFIL